MRAVVVSFVVVVSSLSFFGCGSDGAAASGDADPQRDATPIVTDDGASDAPASETDAGQCWVSHSTDTSSFECDACSQVQCKSQWDAAWGAGWPSDDYGAGPCAADAKCLCNCNEEDLVCREGCDITYEGDACRAAKQAIYDCETAHCAVMCGRTL